VNVDSLRKTTFTFHSPLVLEDCADAVSGIGFQLPDLWDGRSQTVAIRPISYDQVEFSVKRLRRSRLGHKVTATAAGLMLDGGDGTTHVDMTVRRTGAFLLVDGITLAAAFLVDIFLFGAPVRVFMLMLLVFGWSRLRIELDRRDLVNDIAFAINPHKPKKKKKRGKRKS
jgi:hypothetical protein